MNKLIRVYTKMRLPSLLSVLLLTACASTTNYKFKKPDLVLPEKLPSTQNDATIKVNTVDEAWYHVYADSSLDKLEEEALLQNADLKLAAVKILEVRAQLGITEADNQPSVTANLRQSRTQVTAAGATPLPSISPRQQNATHLSLDASYEIDFWGKLRRASEASRADLLSAESAKKTIRLGLTTQIAQQYFTLVSLDGQEAAIKQVMEGRRERLALNGKQLDAGVIAEYDLHQAQAEISSLQVQLASITQARDKQEGLLSVLLGRSPRAILNNPVLRGKPALMLTSIPEGLPAELLLQRPDLKDAEQRLIALDARIEVARAQYFPSIILTSYLGTESAAFSNLFSGPAGIYQFVAGISQPIFNSGRTEYQVKVAQARRDQALIQYQQAVATAFAEVRTALSAQESARQTLIFENSRSEVLAQASKQAQLRFDAGISSRLELLDVERNYLQSQLNRLEAERVQRSAVADLFKALGGGWH